MARATAPSPPWIGAFAIALAGVSCASARPDISAEALVTSRYVARGVVYHDDMSLQPTISATWNPALGAVSAGAWANIALADDGAEAGETTEVDLNAEWNGSVAGLALSAGLLHYEFPSAGEPSTDEVYASIAPEDVLLNPTLIAYWDLVEAQGVYACFDISHTLDIGEQVGCTLGSSIGWMESGQADYNFGVDVSGLSNVELGIEFSYAPSNVLGLRCGVAYSRVLDNAFRDAVEHDDVLWFTVGASISL